MTRLLSFFILFVSLGGALTLSSASAQGGTSTRQLGTNLDGVTDYSPQLPFTDLFLISREWFTQCQQGVDPGCTSAKSWDTGEAAQLDTDAQGWVRSLPAPSAAPVYTSVATYWDLPQEFPSGRYVVLYEGRGTIEYGLGATKVPELSTLGRDVVSVDISKGGYSCASPRPIPWATGIMFGRSDLWRKGMRDDCSRIASRHRFSISYDHTKRSVLWIGCARMDHR